MSDNLQTDDWRIAFLLDELPAGERAGIEERLEDDEYFRQILAVEDDLFDAYVRGTLSPERRERFEKKFLTTPAQRLKLHFSRTLLAYRPPRRWFAWLRVPQGRALLLSGAVAMLVLGLGVGWWLSSRPAAPVHQVSAPAPLPVIATFLLGAGQTRDMEPVKPLSAPAGNGLVRFEAALETDPYPAYRASIRLVAGGEIWFQNALKSHGAAAGRAVDVTVPVALLSNRDYLLVLEGVTATGELRIAAQYSFTFAKK